MTDHQAEGQQDERMRGLARESAPRTQVAELKDSLAHHDCAAERKLAQVRALLPTMGGQLGHCEWGCVDALRAALADPEADR